jgi:ribonucleoside-diphosphate reductase alpha chain
MIHHCEACGHTIVDDALPERCPRCGQPTLGSEDKMCPDCGLGSIIYQDGCSVCTACGWAKCG